MSSWFDDARAAIAAMVERETAAWNRKDAATLVRLFHPDMVWPWPPSEEAHDPISWVMPMGRFDADTEVVRPGTRGLREAFDLIDI